jgi:hypothetical protein
MLQWFDSTATLYIYIYICGRDGKVDMSGLDSGDSQVVWVQVPSSVYFFWRLYCSYFFNFDTITYM